MTRKNGRKLALWMSADNTTSPVVGDKVAYVTGLNLSSRSSSTAVTAPGDTAARKVGGIPDGSLRITGRLSLTSGGTDLLLAAHQAAEPRLFTMLWDDDDANDGLDFSALVSEYGQSGGTTSPWDFSAMLDIDGAITEDRTAL